MGLEGDKSRLRVGVEPVISESWVAPHQLMEQELVVVLGETRDLYRVCLRGVQRLLLLLNLYLQVLLLNQELFSLLSPLLFYSGLSFTI